jgi:hypothetical protein
MYKLELDWAGEGTPDEGVLSADGEDVLVLVDFDASPGPSGWPVVRVYAHALDVPKHRAMQELGAWLETHYGIDDELEREDLLDTVTEA